MIIVSQNKKNIVNFDSIFMVDAAPGTVMRETEIKIFYYGVGSHNRTIATYRSEKQAQVVMEEMIRTISEGKSVYRLPPDDPDGALDCGEIY